MNMLPKRFLLICVCILAVVLGGCSQEETGSVTETKSLTEDMSWGPIDVIITATPSKVQFDRDVLLTIKISSPPEIKVKLPDIQDRLSGFILNGSYGGDPLEQGGRTVIEKHFRLTPLLSEEYRLAPMAITYTENGKHPDNASWFATRSIVFEVTEPGSPDSANDITGEIKPIWIPPSAREIMITGASVFAVVLAALIIWILGRKLHREVKLRRMSPKERALKELEFLLAKHLPEKNMVKQFYLELTMIVRMYIERAHHIHAPEQTTEEFLTAVSNDRRFSADVLKTLRFFLEAADLVKFAAHNPGPEAIDTSARTARNYIETDCENMESADNTATEK